MRDPVDHTIPSDLPVAEAGAAKEALVAALAACGGGGLSLELDAPRPTQIALQLLIAGRAEAQRAGVALTLGPRAEAALTPVRAAAQERTEAQA